MQLHAAWAPLRASVELLHHFQSTLELRRGPDTAPFLLPFQPHPTTAQVDGDHLEFRPSSVPAAAEQGSLATAEQDAEAMEAQLQHVLFGSSRSEDMDVGALGGPPLWEDQSGPPGGFATKPPGESLPTSLRSELDEDFANALLAASNGELGADVTSSDEGYHATCVAGESLSLDIQYDDLGNYRTSPKAVTSAEMRSLRKQGAAPTPQLIKGFAPAEEEATEEPEVATCWGAQLHFNGDANCIPNFVPGKLHFKNKFCANCKEGILVPLAHVRGVSAELAACFINKRSEGFWNNAPKSMGGGQYRILNNTAGSTGPRLALFRDEPPEFQWLPVPEHWITDDGCVRLCVAKGTLVPSKTLRCGYSPPAGGQATYKRRISRVAPTDSPSSCRPTQVPALSSLPDRPSSAAYARHLAAGGGQDIAHMSLQHAQRQVNPVGTSTVSPQSTFQSSRYHGVQGDNTEEYNSKLREYKAQLQALQKLQAQLMTMHGELGSEMQGGLLGGFEASPNTAVPASAPNAAPGLDIAVGMTGEEAAGIDAQKQLALFGAAVGVDSALFGPASPLPTRPWPRSSLPRSSLGGGAVAIPAPAPDKYNTPDGYTPEEFANALLEGDASTDEFGIDMASAIETWKANQAAGGGVADESLDVSRASTVCQGLQGLGLEREQMLAEELEQVEKLLPNALSSSTARSPPIPEGATEYDW